MARYRSPQPSLTAQAVDGDPFFRRISHDSFVFYPYGLLLKGMKVNAAQKTKLTRFATKHFSPGWPGAIYLTWSSSAIISGLLFTLIFYLLNLVDSLHIVLILALMFSIVLPCIYIRLYRKHLSYLLGEWQRDQNRMSIGASVRHYSLVYDSMYVHAFNYILLVIACMFFYVFTVFFDSGNLVGAAVSLSCVAALFIVMLFWLAVLVAKRRISNASTHRRTRP